MATLEVSERLAARLRAYAERSNQSVEAVLERFLDQIDSALDADLVQQNPLLALAEASERLEFESGRSDVSANFDAVLNEILDDTAGSTPHGA